MEGKEPTVYACNQCGATEGFVQYSVLNAVSSVQYFEDSSSGERDPIFSDNEVDWSSYKQRFEKAFRCETCGADFDAKDLIRVVSWQPEVQADSTGTWATNALRFATKEEAEASAKGLMGRWMLVTAIRAFPSPDPVNYRWNFNTHTDERI